MESSDSPSPDNFHFSPQLPKTIDDFLLYHQDFLKSLQEWKRNHEHLKKSALKRMTQLKTEIKALTVVMIVEFFAGYLMAVTGVLASLRAPRGPPLPDLGFDAFQFLNLPPWANEWMTLIV